MSQQLTYNVRTGTIQPDTTMSLESKIVIGIVVFAIFVLICFMMYVFIAYSKQCGSRFKSTGKLIKCFESSLKADHVNKTTVIRLKYKGSLELSPSYVNRLSIKLVDVETFGKEPLTIVNKSKNASIKDWYYEYNPFNKVAHIHGLMSNKKHGVFPGELMELHLSENLVSGEIASITGHYK